VAGKFFQRIRFEGGRRSGTELLETLRGGIAGDGTASDVQLRLEPASRRKRVAVFVSKTDHCLYNLLLRHRSGELVCEMSLIVSNHEALRPVAEQFGVPFHVFPVTAATKVEVEAQELARCWPSTRSTSWCLARYMQILSDDFIRHSCPPSRGDAPTTSPRPRRQARWRDRPLRHGGARRGAHHRAGCHSREPLRFTR
jgi:formyltetrahydrofolate hydrolase